VGGAAPGGAAAKAGGAVTTKAAAPQPARHSVPGGLKQAQRRRQRPAPAAAGPQRPSSSQQQSAQAGQPAVGQPPVAPLWRVDDQLANDAGAHVPHASLAEARQHGPLARLHHRRPTRRAAQLLCTSCATVLPSVRRHRRVEWPLDGGLTVGRRPDALALPASSLLPAARLAAAGAARAPGALLYRGGSRRAGGRTLGAAQHQPAVSGEHNERQASGGGGGGRARAHLHQVRVACLASPRCTHLLQVGHRQQHHDGVAALRRRALVGPGGHVHVEVGAAAAGGSRRWRRRLDQPRTCVLGGWAGPPIMDQRWVGVGGLGGGGLGA
jgi:hypothetical protein